MLIDTITRILALAGVQIGVGWIFYQLYLLCGFSKLPFPEAMVLVCFGMFLFYFCTYLIGVVDGN